MPKQFMILAKNGSNPPTYVHNEISAAVAEAERLHNKLGGEVFILQVIGVVKKEQVPVTELKTVTKVLKDLIIETDDLPF